MSMYKKYDFAKEYNKSRYGGPRQISPVGCPFLPNRCYPTFPVKFIIPYTALFSQTGAIPQFSAKQVLSHNFLPNRCYPTILLSNSFQPNRCYPTVFCQIGAIPQFYYPTVFSQIGAIPQFYAKQVLSHNFLQKRCYPINF